MPVLKKAKENHIKAQASSARLCVGCRTTSWQAAQGIFSRHETFLSVETCWDDDLVFAIMLQASCGELGAHNSNIAHIGQQL